MHRAPIASGSTKLGKTRSRAALDGAQPLTGSAYKPVMQIVGEIASSGAAGLSVA